MDITLALEGMAYICMRQKSHDKFHGSKQPLLSQKEFEEDILRCMPLRSLSPVDLSVHNIDVVRHNIRLTVLCRSKHTHFELIADRCASTPRPIEVWTRLAL